MARYDLRLSEAEFWRSTLHELTLLLDRHSAEMKFRAACAGAKVEDDQPAPQSLEQQHAMFAARVAAHNGRIQNPNQAAP